MSETYNLSRRKFIYGAGCMCAASLILPSCTQVALSDRQQFNILSDNFLYSKTFPAYDNFKSQTKLITGTSEYRNLIDTGYRIRDAINVYYESNGEKNPTENFQWEFVLVDDDQTKNAWCMPGGKIAFYTGILDVTKDEDGMAAVMGHEIAHAVAKHSVERASQAVLLNVGTTILDNILDGALSASRVDDYIVQLGINLPYGRLQESEADYLGLIFMTLAGYDNRAAIGVWERMEEASKGRTVPEFLSTHPTPGNRIKKIQEWIPEINGKYT